MVQVVRIPAPPPPAPLCDIINILFGVPRPTLGSGLTIYFLLEFYSLLDYLSHCIPDDAFISLSGLKPFPAESAALFSRGVAVRHNCATCSGRL